MKYKVLAFYILVMICTTIACTREPVCETNGITYNKDIKKILSSCAVPDCHVSNFKYGGVSNYDETTRYIIIGKLIPSINHKPGAKPMPKIGQKLSDCDLAKIDAWVTAGMPEN